MTGQLTRPTVLIVEDDEGYRTLLARFLAPDCNVLTAGTGAEALRVIAAERPALVLTDILMPGMDGVALLAKLRADPATRSIPVIVLLATAFPDDLRTAKRLRADAMIAKEQTTRSLVRTTVDALLGSAQRGAP